MKLNELYAKPIKEVVDGMEMVDLKVHTDDAGNVRSVEVKFANDSEGIDVPKRNSYERNPIF